MTQGTHGPTALDPDVLQELARVAGRWQQLPLGHAYAAAPAVRALAQQLADETAHAAGRPPQALPDLVDTHGPAVVLDQLRVCVYDALQGPDASVQETGQSVTARLARLRRELS